MKGLPVEPTLSLFAQEQFRMCRLQVYNWGTFSGLHDIPLSARGFLFVGPSGAGKSTLLDAFRPCWFRQGGSILTPLRARPSAAGAIGTF